MEARWSLTIDCGQPAKLARFWALALTAAGATVIRQDDLRGRPDHVVMADPEGNEFCLV
ncbi:VOC family protein [Microbispora sp. CA-135349]|uniref:VOC family protein n=1 Tax=Microbispora sp. CA-135349 TaxID=3239953 RepID=UPI003D902DA9